MEIQVNDIIDVEMKLDLVIPEDDLSKSTIDPSDYKQNYEISYHNKRSSAFCDVSFQVDAGFSPCFSDINSYLQESLSDDLCEIVEFEILESSVEDPDYQTATIKVISVKE